MARTSAQNKQLRIRDHERNVAIQRAEEEGRKLPTSVKELGGDVIKSLLDGDPKESGSEHQSGRPENKG